MSLRSSSQFRRSGQRDDRRRRLLAEEALGPYGADSAPFGPWLGGIGRLTRKSEHYGDADFMEEQPRLIDLIPRRLTTLGLLLLAGLAVVAALEVLYAWASTAEISSVATDGRIAAFDLDGEGSLAVWFSSSVLSLAALVAIMVYTIRRHRVDDYRGYYRIWLWAAMCWLLLSVDETASLHEGFKEMMVQATGTRVFGDGSIWWIIPYFFLLGAVGSRLLVDMRRCLLSCLVFLAAGGCYAVAVVAQLQWILPETGFRGVMLEEGAEMVGSLLLLAAMGLHARHVILDAEGELPQQTAKTKALVNELIEDEQAHTAEEAAAAAVDEWIKIDSPHGTPQPVLKRASGSGTTAPKLDAVPVSRKLTKAEKKALRKRLTQERMERQRSQRKNWK